MAENETRGRWWTPTSWERKYSFAILSILFSFGVLFIVHSFGFAEKEAVVAILATDAVILLVTTIFLTGQAKIDIQALYGRPAQQTQIAPPNGGKVGL